MIQHTHTQAPSHTRREERVEGGGVITEGVPPSTLVAMEADTAAEAATPNALRLDKEGACTAAVHAQ